MPESKHVVTSDEVFAGLRALGAGPGEIIFAHSSLSSFGWVEHGAKTVIEALIRSVSSGGTVVLPTLCQKDKERRFETWDVDTSPSDVGKITEVFRQRTDTRRSDHPTHSVTAFGPHTEQIVSGHAPLLLGILFVLAVYLLPKGIAGGRAQWRSLFPAARAARTTGETT